MVAFLGCVIISIIISYIITLKWGKGSVNESSIIVVGGTIGIVLGVVASFWGGSFVKKEIVVEKYFISPMFFDGKPIAALMEEHDSSVVESDNYIFQIKEGEKVKSIKHYFKKENIFFSLNEGEERYLEVKRGKTCRRRMWIWFFYGGTGIIESKVMLKERDEFLKLPRYYSL